jgi:hypothetical protein
MHLANRRVLGASRSRSGELAPLLFAANDEKKSETSFETETCRAAASLLAAKTNSSGTCRVNFAMAYTYPKLHVTQVDCSRKRHGGRKSTLQSTPVTNAAWLTNRVLEYGRWANWQILVSEYGKPRLADLATSLRTLSPKSLAF